MGRLILSMAEWKDAFRMYYKQYGSLAGMSTTEVYDYYGMEINIGTMLAVLRSKKRKGLLIQRTIAELESMGICWCPSVVNVLKKYYEEFGTINNIDKGTEFNYYGKIYNIHSVRVHVKNLYNKKDYPEDIMQELKSMGIEERKDRLGVFRAYCAQFGTLRNIKQKDTFEYKGKVIGIGKKLANFKYYYRTGRLSESEIKALTEMGFVFGYDKLQPLREYYKEHGTISTVMLHKLKELIRSLRESYANGLLSQPIVDELESMGMVWRVKKTYFITNKLELFEAYFEQFGTLANINSLTTFEYNGEVINIGIMAINMRRPERMVKMTDDEKQRLTKMGFVWDTKNKRASTPINNDECSKIK
ncbi:MAG: helicase associated domain-containing protein [Clostridia bacterium]|nr:helicase associated domain-containing protein [Clostridia bacterium]